ncbi:hypothetical protein K1719_024329 [Acacia pycnantha]|nr:hypothetical protein K1719_024329 [Acacia pycnantha]
MVLRLYGLEGLRNQIRSHIDLTAHFEKLVRGVCEGMHGLGREKGGGRFMCSYCGHISKRPILDLPVPPGLGISNSNIVKIFEEGKEVGRTTELLKPEEVIVQVETHE